MLEFFLIIVGFFLLVKGADYLITGSEVIAYKFKIPQSIIGLTLVAFGTSVPELFISIQASMTGTSDLILGNLIGTNITNILLIIGIAALFKNITFSKENIKTELPFVVFTTFLFYFLANNGSGISKNDSLLLIGTLAIFLIFLFNVKKRTLGRPKNPNLSFLKTIGFILSGIVLLILGSRLVIDYSMALAELLNVNEGIIGLTIIALGTSMPEIVTFIVTTLKGENEMALGNIIGSNIINLTLIVGISSLVNPIKYDTFYNEHLIILIIASFLLLIFANISKKHTLTKKHALLFILLYGIYLILLI